MDYVYRQVINENGIFYKGKGKDLNIFGRLAKVITFDKYFDELYTQSWRLDSHIRRAYGIKPNAKLKG